MGVLDVLAQLADQAGQKAIRHVRTPAGKEQYGEDIGEIITPSPLPGDIPDVYPAIHALDEGPWRILRVEDTRDYVEQEGTFGDRIVRLPGTGSARACDRCGRQHEIHVTVETPSHVHYVVGLGCARVGHPEIDDNLKAQASAATTLAKLESQQQAIAARWDTYTRNLAKVRALTAPDHTVDEAVRFGKPSLRLTTADGLASWTIPPHFLTFSADLDEYRLRQARDKVMADARDALEREWRDQVMRDRGFDPREYQALGSRRADVEERLGRARKKVAKLQAQANRVEVARLHEEKAGVRHVRTPEGSHRYGKPIGTPIAPHPDLGETLEKALATFDGKRFLDPDLAESECYEASNAFAHLVDGKVAYYTNPIRPDRLPDWADPHDMTGDGEVGHVAVHLGDLVIDWTARQFWPTISVPLIEPKAVYRHRFERFDAVEPPWPQRPIGPDASKGVDVLGVLGKATVRRVRTPEGAHHFHAPIGTPIIPGAEIAAREPTATPFEWTAEHIPLVGPVSPAFRRRYAAARAALPDDSAAWFDADAIARFDRDWQRADASPGPKSLAAEAAIRAIGKVVDTEVARRLKASGIHPPMTDRQRKALRRKRDPIFNEWTDRKWALMDKVSHQLYGKPWTELVGGDEDWHGVHGINERIIAEIHRRHPDLAELRRQSDELLARLVASDDPRYAAAYAAALRTVLSEIRPMGGDLIHHLDLGTPGLRRPAAAAGPNSGLIPYQWRYQGPPWNPRQPRAVLMDRRAIKDFRRLHPQDSKLVRQAVHDLEAGKAQLNSKTRDLSGTYAINFSGAGRILVYPHVDGTWHIYGISAHHDYREAERRAAGPIPTPPFEVGAKVNLPHWTGRQIGPAAEYYMAAGPGPDKARKLGEPEWDDRITLTTDRARAERGTSLYSDAVVQTWKLDPDSRIFAVNLPDIDHNPANYVSIIREAQAAGFDAVWLGRSGVLVIHQDKATRTDTLDIDDLAMREAQATTVMHDAAQHYPASWVEASNAAKRFAVGQAGADGRGYYSHRRSLDRAGLYLGEDLTRPDVAIHELGHRMEYVMPQLRAAEWAFHWRRTSKTRTGSVGAGGADMDRAITNLDDARERLSIVRNGIASSEELQRRFGPDDAYAERRAREIAVNRDYERIISGQVAEYEAEIASLRKTITYLTDREAAISLKEKFPGSRYDDNEMAREDKYITPYVGKDYGDSPRSIYEVLTMGMEGVWTGSQPMHKDADHRQLILGLLAAA